MVHRIINTLRNKYSKYNIIKRKENNVMNLEWIDKIDYKKYVLPCKINSDKEYLPKLKEVLENLVCELRCLGLDNKIVSEIEKCANGIVLSVELYYQGNIVDAQSMIIDIINSFKDKSPAITKVNNSIAFPQYLDSNKHEVQFFRARLNETVVDYSANEMLHIPFNKREIVKSERFSIPGLPCLYLGNSSYVCWIEMGSPAEHKFNVSPVVLDNTQKVFNLTVSIRDLYSIKEMENEVGNNKELEEYTINLLKLLVLAISTSFTVPNSNRNFKSEYIVSQMIMLACKNRNIDGITYYSKRVSDELFASVVGINLVLFATYNGEDELSSICEHISIGDSLNFSMFKQLLPSLQCKEYDLRIDKSPYIKNIGSFKRQFPYNETQFYYFDKYLFANWDRN